MNSSIKWMAMVISLWSSVYVHAYTFEFVNHTIQNLVIKLKLKNGVEKSLELAAKGTAKAIFDVIGDLGCTEYIKIRKRNGEVVDPKLILVNEDKYAAFLYKEAMREPIDLEELAAAGHVPGTPKGMEIYRLTQVCGTMVLHVFMDMDGDLVVVFVNNQRPV